jgi:hypothetical protein
MISTAIAVGTDGRVTVSLGATYAILIGILFLHGIVCSAATRILARLNLFYVTVNSEYLVFANSYILFVFCSRYQCRCHHCTSCRSWRESGFNT